MLRPGARADVGGDAPRAQLGRYAVHPRCLRAVHDDWAPARPKLCQRETLARGGGARIPPKVGWTAASRRVVLSFRGRRAMRESPFLTRRSVT
jgi:hypothetical protein